MGWFGGSKVTFSRFSGQCDLQQDFWDSVTFSRQQVLEAEL